MLPLKKTTFVSSLMLAGVFCALGAAAQYPTTSYTLSDDGLTLESWNGPETEIDMNSDEALAAVTAIGNNAFRDKQVTKVIVGDKVESLGFWSFFDCTQLSELTLPASLTAIKNAAFSGCKSLTDIALPESLETIGNSAFYDCRALASITIPAKVTVIPDGCFNACTALARITLPEGITSLGEESFKGCTSLTSLDLPEELAVINAYAFEACSGLAEVKFGSNLEEIGTSAFSEAGLLSLDLSSLEKELSTGFNAFQNCVNLKSVVLPAKVYNIASGMLQGCTALETITIPDTWEEVPVKLCNGCSGLKSVTLGTGVATIKNTAFFECSSLEQINWNDVLETIEWNAFFGCNALKSIELPESLISIDDFAFNGCEELASVKLGSKVTTIGQETFSELPKLTDFTIDALTPPALGANCFYHANQENAKLYCPAESVAIYGEAEQWKEFGAILAAGSGIGTIEASETEEAEIYTLDGVKVRDGEQTSGIYVRNGRKLLVK